MIVDFEATVYRWVARTDAAWFFLDLPPDLSEQIHQMQDPALRRGFGAVRVRASVGTSTWTTSMFPSGGTGPYALPLKRSVRDREGLREGDTTDVHLEVGV